MPRTTPTAALMKTPTAARGYMCPECTAANATRRDRPLLIAQSAKLSHRALLTTKRVAIAVAPVVRPLAGTFVIGQRMFDENLAVAKARLPGIAVAVIEALAQSLGGSNAFERTVASIVADADAFFTSATSRATVKAASGGQSRHKLRQSPTNPPVPTQGGTAVAAARSTSTPDAAAHRDSEEIATGVVRPTATTAAGSTSSDAAQSRSSSTTGGGRSGRDDWPSRVGIPRPVASPAAAPVSAANNGGQRKRLREGDVQSTQTTTPASGAPLAADETKYSVARPILPVASSAGDSDTAVHPPPKVLENVQAPSRSGQSAGSLSAGTASSSPQTISHTPHLTLTYPAPAQQDPQIRVVNIEETHVNAQVRVEGEPTEASEASIGSATDRCGSNQQGTVATCGVFLPRVRVQLRQCTLICVGDGIEELDTEGEGLLVAAKAQVKAASPLPIGCSVSGADEAMQPSARSVRFLTSS